MITLSAAREKELIAALVNAFRPDAFERRVLDPMRVPSDVRSASRDYQTRVAELVRWAVGETRVEELLRVALEANTYSEALRLVGEALGLLPPSSRLVETIRPALRPGGEKDWLKGLAEVTEQVCFIEFEGKFVGSGFLVGPDQVMSHASVTTGGAQGGVDVADRVRVSFGASKARQTYRGVSTVVTTPIGLIVLQLDGPAGRDSPGGGLGAAARARGWITPREGAKNPAVVIVQYVVGADAQSVHHQTVSIEADGLLPGDDIYLKYRTSTQRGSTGSPCFDAYWRLIGMHASFTPENSNQGIAIAALIEQLRSADFVWDVTSGVHGAKTQDTRQKPKEEPPQKLDQLVRDFQVKSDREDPADDVWNDDTLYEPSDPDRWAWAEAASTTACFDPETLVTKGMPALKARIAVLLESTPVARSDGSSRWMLSERVRVRALERLAKRGQLSVLRKANGGDGSDMLDVALGNLIAGKQPARAELQNPDRLRAVMQAVGWLSRTGLAVPDAEELRAQLERATILAPFRHLTRGFFAGRDAELEQLAAYVNGPDAGRGGAPSAPIFIHGPGGMGKSALLAHFILRHSERDTTKPDVWNPFIYLDFDRPELDARDLSGVLLAMARQIGPQAPRIRGRSDKFIEAWTKKRREVRRDPNATVARGKGSPPVTLSPENLASMVKELAAILSDLTSLPRPLVLVLDTLEEVQYATPDAVATLVALVIKLRAAVPMLRHVLAGRVEPHADAKVTPMPLLPLEEQGAEALLGNHLPPSLAVKTDLIARMVRIVGGNPLSLRLAADVLGREATDKLDVLGEVQLWERVGDAVVQGQLYERIVKHVHKKSIQSLAVPGLVLRYLTWELIRDVVAEPCGVKVANDQEAQALFTDLAKEIALVRQGGDPSRLVLRPELRRTVLESFRKDRRSVDKRRLIHEKAVKYFKGLPGVANRAEEIYHRLWLDQDPGEIDARWLTGIELGLRSAVEELDGRARLYLANRVGGVDEQALLKAPLAEWEASAERRASDLLRLGLPDAALRILKARPERLATSRLHAIESVALRSLPEPELRSAETAAEKAITAARASGNPGEIQGSLLELVQVRRLQGDNAGVLRALADLGNLGEQLGDDLVLLQSEVEGLEALGTFDAIEKFSEPAVRVFSRLPDELIARAPELARRVAAQTGGVNPEVLQRVIKLVGIGSLNEQSAATLESVLVDWAQRDEGIAPFVPPANASASELTSAAQYLLANRKPDTRTATLLSSWLQEAVGPSGRNL